jgi:beta-lactamase regulating signal transducer with metallopeptidase domain
MVQTFLPFATRLAQAIGWSLLHSLWQGALIYLLLLILFRVFPAMHSRVKHLCSVMALMLLLIWTVNTGISQWQLLQPLAVHVTTGAQDAATAYIIEVSPPQSGYTRVIAGAYPFLTPAMPYVTLLYCLGILAMLFRLGTGFAHLHQLRSRDVVIPDERLLSMLHHLQLQLGMVQEVTVRLSAHVLIPMVIGVMRPMILLPVTIADDLGPSGLEAILLHELAHISRADFLINLFQSIVETLLFFNPFAWRISASIRREREHCCDDLVVAHIGQPLTYARALVSLAGRRQDVPSMALGATGERPLLFNRIKRIIEMKKHPLRYGQIIAACSLAAILVTVSIACFTPSFAQHSKKKGNTARQAYKDADNKSSGTIIMIDSNGVRHVYNSEASQPPEGKAALDRSRRALEQSGAQLEPAQKTVDNAFSNVHIPEPPAVPEPPEAGVPGIPAVPAVSGIPAVPDVPEIPDVDSILEVASLATQEALSHIDWDAIRTQVDSARIQIEGIDWKRFNRDLNRSINKSLSHPDYRQLNQRIAKATRICNDPRLAEEIRREVAAARREASRAIQEGQRAREESLRSGQEARQAAEETRREMERARRRMERARREMERAREELEQLKGR